MAPALPDKYKLAVVCIYNAMKSNPAILAVDVYAPDTSVPLIAYAFRSMDGKQRRL
jgi:hypothetical protein